MTTSLKAFAKVISNILAVAAFFSAYVADASFGKDLTPREKYLDELQAFIVLNKINSVRYDPILARYNELRGGGICSSNYSQIAGRDCKTVLVIKHEFTKNPPAGPYRDILKGLDQNALALEPRLLLVDELWLDMLLVSIINQQSYLLTNIDRLETKYILARYQFYTEMRRTIFQDKEYSKWIKPLDVTADLYIEDLTSSNPAKFGVDISKILISSLGLLFEHEFAHLDIEAPYYRELQQLETNRSTGAIDHETFVRGRVQARAREERRADEIAISSTQKLMAGQFPTDQGGLEDARELYSKFPLLGMSTLFRDRALFLGMDGFRGMRSEDIMFELSHNGCDEERGSGFFNDPLIIKTARERPLPVMTRAEFDQARERLLAEKPGEEVYDHYFERAKNIEHSIRQAKRGDIFDFLDLSDHLQLVDALVHNEPNRALAKGKLKLFPPLDGAAPISEVLRVAKEFANFERGVTCPREDCYVGRLPDDMGFMELIGDDNQLAEVRWMFKVTGYSNKQYIDNMVKMTVLFLTLGGDKPLEALISMRAPVFKCHVAGAFLETKNRVYHATTANREGWIYIRIFSPKMFAALGLDPEPKPDLYERKLRPSFSCDGTLTPDENAICSDDQLVSLDVRMERKYRERIRNDDTAIVAQEQKQWLKERRNCQSDRRCIKKIYDNRIHQLISNTRQPLSADSTTAYRQKRSSSTQESPASKSPAPKIARIRSNVSLGIHNMRDGPGVNYSVVASIPAGERVRFFGNCQQPQDRGQSRNRWCEVQWKGHHGWASLSGLLLLDD